MCNLRGGGGGISWRIAQQRPWDNGFRRISDGTAVPTSSPAFGFFSFAIPPFQVTDHHYHRCFFLSSKTPTLFLKIPYLFLLFCFFKFREAFLCSCRQNTFQDGMMMIIPETNSRRFFFCSLLWFGGEMVVCCRRKRWWIFWE